MLHRPHLVPFAKNDNGKQINPGRACHRSWVGSSRGYFAGNQPIWEHHWSFVDARNFPRRSRKIFFSHGSYPHSWRDFARNHGAHPNFRHQSNHAHPMGWLRGRNTDCVFQWMGGVHLDDSPRAKKSNLSGFAVYCLLIGVLALILH